MSIDISTARKVAHLARIAVKEEDLPALAGELSAVLGAHAGPGTVSVVVSPLTGGPQGDRLPARFGQG